MFLNYLEPSPKNRISLKKTNHIDTPCKPNYNFNSRTNNIDLGKPFTFDLTKPNDLKIDLNNKPTIDLTSGAKSSNFNNSVFDLTETNGHNSNVQNGTKYKTSYSNSFNNRRRYSYSTSLNQSFRLDEKRRYGELLSRAAPNANISSLIDSIAEYGTPVGKLFNSTSSRSRRMVEMANKSLSNKKKSSFIDLTDSDLEKSRSPTFKRPTSTRQTIEKVLNDFDNEVIVIKDSDSDVEVLPNPPEPKPDFVVPRVNSLKTFVDPSEPLHDDWISEL